jgi:anti-sigma regulatory factor (Ser/Thr protein kinase)
MSEWPLHSRLELAALPTAVACARLHAKHLVWEWGLEQLADDIELIVSELVTNSLKATVALGQNGNPRRMTTVPWIELRLYSDGRQVLIEVWDGNHQPPVPQGLGTEGIPALGDEGGRGLFLVETLSHKWGYYATPAAEQGQMVRALSGSRATTVVAPIGRQAVGKVVWVTMVMNPS